MREGTGRGGLLFFQPAARIPVLRAQLWPPTIHHRMLVRNLRAGARNPPSFELIINIWHAKFVPNRLAVVALMSSKDRVNYFPCRALSILPEVKWDCFSRLSSGRTLGGDRSNSDQESLNSKVGLTVAVVVIDRVPEIILSMHQSHIATHHTQLASTSTSK